MSAVAHDAQTIAFYDKEADVYAARREAVLSANLERFIKQIGKGAHVLELGCGGGQDAELMLAAGLDVTPTDGSPNLAAQAEQRLGKPVRVMRFDELDAHEAYEGVWASACLLHAPTAAQPDIAARIWRALKPGGLFFSSYKLGEGGGRDDLGRYYNFPRRAEIEQIYRGAGAWAALQFEEKLGGGYDGVARTWLLCFAAKA